MRVLVTAPHPFYQERGSPVGVDMVLRALSERGDAVDVLTYHEGADRHYPGVSLYRIPKPFGIRNVPPGPSFKKLICDVYLFASLVRRLRRNHYDVIHAVEESAFMAMILKPMTSVPFVYDMDSALSTQIVEKYRILRPARRLLRYIGSLPVRRAAAVAPVCESLANEVSADAPGRVTVFRDVSLLDAPSAVSPSQSLRDSLGISGTISMYVGDLEPSQGIELLLESFARAHLQHKDGHLILIGGTEKAIAYYKVYAGRFGMQQYVHFLGQRPLTELGAYMAQADVLVSPCIRAPGTPMRLYSYLHSAVPVLATDLPIHNQVLTPDIACLAPANVSRFSEAWVGLLRNLDGARDMGRRGRAFAEREHSYETLRASVNTLYAQLDQHVVGRLSPPARL